MLGKYYRFYIYNGTDESFIYNDGDRITMSLLPWKMTNGAMVYGSEINVDPNFAADDVFAVGGYVASAPIDNSANKYMGVHGTIKTTSSAPDHNKGVLKIYMETSTDDNVWPTFQADYDVAEDCDLIATMQISTGIGTLTRATNFEIGENLKLGTIARNAAMAQRPEAWDKLKLFLPFMEGGGVTALDASGQKNDGTITGASWVPGGLYFDGNDKIEISDTSILEPVSMSIVAYANVPADGQWRRLVSKDNNGYSLLQADDNTIRLIINNVWDVTGAAVTAGWHHIVGVFDDTTNTVKVYVDGKLGDSRAEAASAVYAAVPLYIGQSALAGQFWVGGMEYVAIYDHALTPNQISQIHALGRAYWLERRMGPSFMSLAPPSGTILPHMMQLCV